MSECHLHLLLPCDRVLPLVACPVFKICKMDANRRLMYLQMVRRQCRDRACGSAHYTGSPVGTTFTSDVTAALSVDAGPYYTTSPPNDTVNTLVMPSSVEQGVTQGNPGPKDIAETQSGCLRRGQADAGTRFGSRHKFLDSPRCFSYGPVSNTPEGSRPCQNRSGKSPRESGNSGEFPAFPRKPWPRNSISPLKLTKGTKAAKRTCP